MAIVGRESLVDIALPFPGVSSRHACLEALGAGRFRVTDLGSSNGTYVRGQRVTSADVQFGEDLRFGSIVFEWNQHRGVLDAEAALPRGLVLGRDPSCDLVVSDGRVSSRHLRVIPQQGGLLLLDVGSANGVAVNGRPVTKALISPSDQVTLGSMRIDVFGLVNAKNAPRPAPAPVPTYVPPPAPAVALAPPPQRDTGFPMWGKVLAAVLVLALFGVGAVFATRVDVIEPCELCPTPVVQRNGVFFWERQRVQADAARERSEIRWCNQHAEEPIDVTKTFVCKHCGKTYGTPEVVKRPRRAAPGGTMEDRTGYCPHDLEEVPERKKILCSLAKCRTPYDTEVTMRPRYLAKDTEEVRGYCSALHHMEDTSRDAAAGAGDLLRDLIQR
ncbi:MAG: FHA domain-containing protein [Vicinamibacteria bacterium]|nr:FHA domain-containing protein [Vicinamibacteria bacterium]